MNQLFADDFSVDQLTATPPRYVYLQGSGAYTVSGGRLVMSETANTAGVRIQGARLQDGRVTAKVRRGPNIFTGGPFHTFGAYFRMTATNTMLLGRYDVAGAVLAIRKQTAGGGFTNIATTPAPVVPLNSDYWIRVTFNGNDVTVELFTSDPATGAAAAATLNHTLAGADATAFGAGIKGEVGFRHTGEIDGEEWADELLVESITPPALWLIGDGADGGATAQAVASQVVNAAHFVYLGDVYGSPNNMGDASGFTNGYEPVYGTLKPITKPTPGNHDWSDTLSGRPGPTLHTQAGAYDAYWGAKAKPDGTNHYYSFTHNGWKIIVINTEELGGWPTDGISPTQQAWLESELAADGTMKIVCGHRPPYSADTTWGDVPELASVFTAMEGHAVAYISGHGHSLQRHTPRNGVTQLVVGAGGHDFYPLNGAYPGVAYSTNTVHGALKLDLSAGGSLTGTFISSAGAVLDTFTIAAEAPPVPEAPPELDATVAGRIYDRWEPYWTTDAANGYVLEHIADAVGDTLQPVDDVSRDTDTHEAWHVLFDPASTPPWALPWLAQVVGVRLQPADTEADQRLRIAQAAGFYRGSTQAIVDEVKRTLTGNQTVNVIKTGAWALTVTTRTSETPDAAAAERAARAQKPAGVLLTFVTSDVPIIDEGGASRTIDAIGSAGTTIDAITVADWT